MFLKAAMADGDASCRRAAVSPLSDGRDVRQKVNGS